MVPGRRDGQEIDEFVRYDLVRSSKRENEKEPDLRDQVNKRLTEEE